MNTFLFKPNKVKPDFFWNSTKNTNLKLNFFFFKYYKFLSFQRGLDFSFYNNQFKNLNSLITQAISSKKNFLIIDDLTLNSQINIYNFLMYPELVFFFKFLTFIYSRGKKKKLFSLYLSKIITKKKVLFFVFLNEQFFIKNITLFNRFKTPKISFITSKRYYPLVDYPIFTPSTSFINQRVFYFYFYSLIKLSFFEKFKKSNIYLIKFL